MAKSSTAKGKRAAKAERLPSPAPSSSSSSASPSSKSDADSDSDSSSSGSGSDRESSASPEPVAVAQPRRDLDPEALKYTPPEGFKQVKATAVASGIDWDQIKEDADLELWTVRVPAGVKTKHLDGLTLTLPEGDLADPVQPVGTFTAKKAEYNVYLASASSAATSSKRRRDEQEEDEAAASGQGPAGELQTLVPLLPRKSQGNKLFQAPRPVARTLTITRALPPSIVASTSALLHHNDGHSTLIQSQPSPVPGAILTADELLDADLAAKRKRQVRGDAQRDQPTELLKFRMGAVAGLGAQGGKGKYHNPVEPIVIVDREQLFEDLAQVENAAEGDVEMAAAAEEDAVAPAAGQEDAEAARKREKKEKKRAKAEGASPKKKKVKTEA
ncbi:hypothetical protein JCM8115_002231 [Rhodotorula mucilaginosa]|uniref:Uncharacterized protein n=1 Tax=Rhodotorula mucilaginosa TaxID=5537 RepID=A0A9P6W8H8_RHOMI|nr:hypothetical protein C6P46_005980 [Rhodotorula mucilaginosa]